MGFTFGITKAKLVSVNERGEADVKDEAALIRIAGMKSDLADQVFIRAKQWLLA